MHASIFFAYRVLQMLDEHISAEPTQRIIIISQQWAVLAGKWEFTMLISVGIFEVLQAYSVLVRGREGRRVSCL